jgi:hypothetical protein
VTLVPSRMRVLPAAYPELIAVLAAAGWCCWAGHVAASSEPKTPWWKKRIHREALWDRRSFRGQEQGPKGLYLEAAPGHRREGADHKALETLVTAASGQELDGPTTAPSADPGSRQQEAAGQARRIRPALAAPGC